jgi:hypothetical protein
LQHNLPSAVNLGHGDLRLFSIYGVPPSNNIVFSKKPKQKSRKRRDPSSILQYQPPITLPDVSALYAPHV